MLNRLGNKKKLAKKIEQHFPAHDCYIEPFFGAGGMFFNKQKVKYNIVNDLDSDVYNLYNVLINQKNELVDAIDMMPIHLDLFNHWKKNKETDPIKKAVRFLFLSNFSFMGMGDGLRFGKLNTKEILLKNINETYSNLKDVQFSNKDFRKFIKSIMSKRQAEKNKTFIYCDPPYQKTGDNYSNSFTQQDFIDLLDILIDKGANFAISEFENDFVVEESKKRSLNIIEIEKRSLMNTGTIKKEILITNYINESNLLIE
jgi:DNA adenine methylase